MRERRQNKSIGQSPNSILVSVCAACVFTALFLLFFPEISPEIKNPAYAKPLATLALSEAENDGGIGLDELSDYSPMFIPTRWNATPKIPALPKPAGWDFGKTADGNIAKDLLNESFLLDAKADLERGKSGLMKSVMRNFFSGYKRADIRQSPKSANEIVFRLVDMNNGKIIKTENIKMESPNGMFSIAEFKVYVERDGWAMKPLELQSSGNDENDIELSRLLSNAKLLKGIPKGEYKAVFIP